MNGLALAAKLRGELPTLQIILMSANDLSTSIGRRSTRRA